MFHHPSHSAQFAADHQAARHADALRRRARRGAGVDRLAADIGEHVATVGLDAAHGDVDAAIGLARRLGVGRDLAAIVADLRQPTVVRERALGRLLAALAATADRPATRTEAPAA